MKKIGLTGGIASGKSTVLNYFKEKGVPYIDADIVAREIVEPGESAYKEIVQYFGPKSIRKDGSLDRAYLGKIVFSNPNEKEVLDKIVTQPIKNRILRREKELEKLGYKGIIFDIPLLIEAGWVSYMDEVWLVYSEREVRIDRLFTRNGYNREEAIQRIDSQMDLDEKKKYAQYIIENNEDLPSLQRELDILWNKKKSYFGKV